MGVRSHETPHYECRACQTCVSPLAYRAACPACGGTLRVATRDRR